MADKRNIPGVVYVKNGVNLCQFGGFSCFGCCGYSFKGKDIAASSLIKQSTEFSKSCSSREEKVKFRDRAPAEELNSCNFCQNLVLKDENLVHNEGNFISTDDIKLFDKESILNKRQVQTFCPFHPALNNGEELREGHCEHDYMCKTQIYFHSLSDEQKQSFAGWLTIRIAKEDIDWYTYSVNMDTNKFLNEFLSVYPNMKAANAELK